MYRQVLACAGVLATCSMAYGQGGCDNPLTQNASDVLDTGGVACAADGITTENSYCRSFSVIGDYQISCVSFGITNGGSDVPATCNVYLDTNGGAPQAPGIDLELLGSVAYNHISTPGESIDVTFADPICVAGGTTFVVEISIDPSVDGFATYYGNSAGESGFTYIRSDSCGIAEYITCDSIGFGNLHWYVNVVGGDGCDASNSCDCFSGSDCQIPHNYPGCEDPLCEAIVCSFDDFCCTDEWDDTCAETANALCGAGGFDCDYPSCNVEETELCGEATNNGCNVDKGEEPQYQDIEVGDTVCGTYYQSSAEDFRDTDWYRFTIAEKSIVTWTVHSRLSVDAFIINDQCGDGIAIVGIGSGDCPSVASACLEAGTYVGFVAIGTPGDVPCGTPDYTEYTAGLTAEPVNGCPGYDDCPGGTDELTQNSSLDINIGGIACQAGGITTENWYARSYELANSPLAGSDALITCVEWGSQNTGSDVPAKIGIYLDTDGGAPQAPGVDMELLGERETVSISAAFGLQRAAFDPPICVPADSTIVVTLYLDPSTDGFATFAGNGDAEDGPTYILSESCGLATFTPLGDIGFPDNKWVHIVEATAGCETSDCPGDINNDGLVDGADFGLLLSAWGQCPGCPEDLSGDGNVDGADVGLLLSAWGACP
ncbi:MAG: hypothetical protein MK085_07020 [Phycisphaerales bacterium]|nr:hypothetical protein [Phycisphaerales bacterium]